MIRQETFRYGKTITCSRLS